MKQFYKIIFSITLVAAFILGYNNCTIQSVESLSKQDNNSTSEVITDSNNNENSNETSDSETKNYRPDLWLLKHFTNAPKLTGKLEERTQVEAPHLIQDVDVCCGKYALDLEPNNNNQNLEVGFLNVKISELMSNDIYGAGVRTSSPIDVFMVNVEVNPMWRLWQGYDQTNYDGLDFDGGGKIYIDGLTITDWNADGGIDVKADEGTQFVNVTIKGTGNRAIRYWRQAKHYLVNSSINNDGKNGDGVLLWFRYCDQSTLYVYKTSFNGLDKVSANDILCEQGNAPNIIYLEKDPRTTGEMHPMFSYEE
jgi:hypothetical protein